MEFVTALRGSFDPAKPSLFELLSEQQLSSLLPPTIRYLFTLLTHRYPRYLLRPLNSFDEIYALLSLLVERHYLITRGGTFTEHFYGLKREKALAAEIPRASTHAPGVVRETLALTARSDIYKNLLVLVGIPYLKRKLDEAHEVDAPRALMGAAYNQLPPNPTLAQKVAHYWRVIFLRRIYPYLNAAYYLSLLGFNLGYLFDNTKYHDPFLWLINTRVRRMGGADYQALEKLSKSPAAGGARRTILSRMLGGLSLVLPTSIFALKFLEWWYASDFAKQLSAKASESLELPPPILPSNPKPKPQRKKNTTIKKQDKGEGEEDQDKENEKADGSEEKTKEEVEEQLKAAAPISATSLLPIFTVPAPEDSELCPICEGEIVTPAACQTGVVYCFTCIHKWLTGTHARQEEFMKDREAGKWESGEGRCAVTGRRVLAGTEGLRRVMV